MLLYSGLLLCFLCGFTDIRVADIQVAEMAVLAVLPIVTTEALKRLRTSEQLPRLQFHVLVFLALALAGAILSMRLELYPISNTGLLKTPPFATFVRLFQVALTISSLFVVGLAVQGSRKNLDRLLQAFVLGALANAIFGIVSWVLWHVGVELRGAYEVDFVRLRGFFVEGGPVGVYLVGGMVIQSIRYFYLRSISTFMFAITTTLIAIAFALAQSKAGYLLLGVLAVYVLYLRRSIGISVLIVGVAIAVVAATPLLTGLQGYYQSLYQFQTHLSARPDDTNLIAGRLMAAVLLPRMVEAYPITGIGIGNYSLMRNNPDITRGLPTVDIWDLPGLGILGYVAELGIPLTLYLLWVFSYPARVSINRNGWIALMSLYPLTATLFGVQLNFAYPWIISGLALAALEVDRQAQRARAMYSRREAEPTPVPFLNPSINR
jgi:hypothetical protein